MFVFVVVVFAVEQNSILSKARDAEKEAKGQLEDVQSKMKVRQTNNAWRIRDGVDLTLPSKFA